MRPSEAEAARIQKAQQIAQQQAENLIQQQLRRQEQEIKNAKGGSGSVGAGSPKGGKGAKGGAQGNGKAQQQVVVSKAQQEEGLRKQA